MNELQSLTAVGDGRPAPALQTGSWADRGIAMVCAIAAGMDVGFGFGMRMGLIAAVVTVVLWGRDAMQHRVFPLLVLVAGLAVASGAILTSLASFDHTTSSATVLARSALLVSVPLVAGMLTWVARLLKPHVMAVLFGAGMLCATTLQPVAQDNPWRFTYSLAVGVLVLALVSRPGVRGLGVAALVGLAVVGLFNDARSNSAMLLLAAILVVTQGLPRLSSRPGRGFGAVAAMGGAAWVIYWGLQSAILEGFFGEATRGRTQAQIEQSGSLILGGRPELAASLALIRDHPWGLGPGTVASYDEIQIAKTAMAAIGYDPQNGYVDRFLFGGPVELHSGFADLWMWFGPLGLAAGLVMMVIILAKFGYAFSHVQLSPLLAYLTVRMSWDFAVSPVSSSARLLTLALALALYRGSTVATLTTARANAS